MYPQADSAPRLTSLLRRYHQLDRLVQLPGARRIERAVAPPPPVRDVHRLEHYSWDLQRAQILQGLARQGQEVEGFDQKDSEGGGRLGELSGTTTYPQCANSASGVEGGM